MLQQNMASLVGSSSIRDTSQNGSCQVNDRLSTWSSICSSKSTAAACCAADEAQLLGLDGSKLAVIIASWADSCPTNVSCTVLCAARSAARCDCCWSLSLLRSRITTSNLIFSFSGQAAAAAAAAGCADDYGQEKDAGAGDLFDTACSNAVCSFSVTHRPKTPSQAIKLDCPRTTMWSETLTLRRLHRWAPAGVNCTTALSSYIMQLCCRPLGRAMCIAFVRSSESKYFTRLPVIIHSSVTYHRLT